MSQIYLIKYSNISDRPTVYHEEYLNTVYTQ